MTATSACDAILRPITTIYERRRGAALFLLIANAASAGMAHAEQQPVSATASDLEEIIVSATRRDESIDKIPISISAFSQERLDEQGIKNIDDLARFTPGLTFSPNSGGLTNNIAIRGVLSEVGASTTGIYIDDTPVQVRSKGIVTENSTPQIFDLERVEVLKGPQGTLFGTGSMGGTIRFITPDPDLHKFSIYSRVEGSSTKSGDPSYEGGVAAGGPIVDGSIGARVSVFYQSIGGFINQRPFDGTAVTNKAIDTADTTVLRGAVKWAPIDQLDITPAIYYQHKRQSAPYFWLNESNPDKTDFNSGYTEPQPSVDTFTLPSLKVDWKFADMELVSDTSFFYRKLSRTSDYSEFLWTALVGDGSSTPDAPLPGYRATSRDAVRQNSFTQEVRLQSTNSDSRLQWVAGALFQSARLYTNQYVLDPQLPALSQAVYGQTIEAAFGEGLINGIYSYAIEQWATDKQTALFGQADFAFTSALKGTLGVRVARDSLSFRRSTDGALANGFLIMTEASAPSTTPVTPKIGLSYQPDTRNLYYVSASKGTREGGVNNPSVASGRPGCPAGLVGPIAYGSDNLWSYEIGAKNQFADGRLRTQASIFYTDWRNIQQTVQSNGCLTTSYVDNLGGATIKGGDLQAELRLLDNWSIAFTGGYQRARYSSTGLGAPGTGGARAVLARSGDSLGVSPWNVTLSSKYDFVVWDKSSYFRLDYSYSAKDPGETPVRDPLNTTVYDPGLVADPAIRLLGARLGMKINGFDVSVFCRNVFNQTPPLGLNHDALGDPLYYGSTVRPRVLGLTATYRY